MPFYSLQNCNRFCTRAKQAVEYEKRAEESYSVAESTPMESKKSTQLSDLDTSVNLLREALVLRPAPHPLRADSRSDLSRALVVRHWETGQIADLDEAIMGYFDALHPEAQLDVCMFINPCTRVPIVYPSFS
jgi:hypothetical protein